MRIISGSAKGKKIISPTDKTTRPLKDMVRESIFNILSHSNLLNNKLDQCILLDLFSGVGSFGLETISRGASKVIFIENYKPVLKLLEKNLENLNFANYAEIYQKDIYKKNSFEGLNEKFNLVFLDPPYRYEDLRIIFEYLKDAKVINSKTLIIIHRHKNSKDEYGNIFKVSREEVYGSSKVIFGYVIF